jgi:large subunit ribosomal protein L16
MRGKAVRGVTILNGDFALQALAPGWVSARQIEAARRSIVRAMKRRGKVWIRIFPDKPITKRAAESRMGKGKGAVEYWAAVVKPGRIMFEVSGLNDEMSVYALKQAQYKISIKTRIVSKKDFIGGQA